MLTQQPVGRLYSDDYNCYNIVVLLHSITLTVSAYQKVVD